MGVRVSVQELAKVFGETHRAIDIRTAAVCEGEAWANALTVVRLTYEEPEAARDRLRQLERTHGQVETRCFRIVMCTHPFLQWKEFCGEIAAGVLRFEGLYFSREVRTLIPSAERNILFEALKHFCPDAEFEGLLVLADGNSRQKDQPL